MKVKEVQVTRECFDSDVTIIIEVAQGQGDSAAIQAMDHAEMLLEKFENPTDRQKRMGQLTRNQQSQKEI